MLITIGLFRITTLLIGSS